VSHTNSADVNGDGVVNNVDVLMVFGGCCDVNGDGVKDTADRDYAISQVGWTASDGADHVEFYAGQVAPTELFDEAGTLVASVAAVALVIALAVVVIRRGLGWFRVVAWAAIVGAAGTASAVDWEYQSHLFRGLEGYQERLQPQLVLTLRNPETSGTIQLQADTQLFGGAPRTYAFWTAASVLLTETDRVRLYNSFAGLEVPDGEKNALANMVSGLPATASGGAFSTFTMPPGYLDLGYRAAGVPPFPIETVANGANVYSLAGLPDPNADSGVHIQEFSDAVSIPSLIGEFGVLGASVAGGATLLAMTFWVISIGLSWFRG